MANIIPNGREGFTLVELLVVVTIIGVAFAAGIAAYNNFNDQQKVLQAAKNFAQDLRLAQKKADSGEKPAGCNDTLSGYSVTGSASGTTFTIQADCGSDGYISVGTRELVNDTYFSANFTVYFRVLAQGVSSAQTITVRNLGGTRTNTIVVSSGGAISVN